MAALTCLLSLVIACQAPGGATTTGPPDSTAAGGACVDAPLAPPLVPEGLGPNLVWISLDTLRKDRVGRYSGTDVTPWLDGFLASGLALDDLRACANWTLASMLCSLGGLTNVDRQLQPRPQDPASVPADLDLLPHWLLDAGYATALVSGNPHVGDPYPTGAAYAVEVRDAKAPAAELASAALVALDDLLSGVEGAPWLLHLHLNDAHSPYDPGEAWLAPEVAGLDPIAWDLADADDLDALRDGWADLDESTRALVMAWLEAHYRAELRALDAALATFHQGLTDRGALDHAVVVLQSDHGEQFFEHGGFRHANSLHQEEANAFGGLWWPGVVPEAVTAPLHQVDLAPTVLHALGVAAPRALTGAVVGRHQEPRTRASFVSLDLAKGPQHSVERAGARVLYSWSGDRSVYATTDDPAELNDLYEPGAEPACLAAALVDEVERVVPWLPTDRAPRDLIR